MNLFQRIRQFERQLIEQTIADCGGHKARAAEILGISPRLIYDKTRRDWQRVDPDERWDDPPLAWAVRMEGDRVEVGACWTRDEIEADATNKTTVALVLERGTADALAREINTTIAVNAAVQPIRVVVPSPEPIPVYETKKPFVAATPAICEACGESFYAAPGFRFLCRDCRHTRVKDGIAFHRPPWRVAKVG